MRILMCKCVMRLGELAEIDTDVISECGCHRSQNFDRLLFDPADPAGLASGVHPGGKSAEGRAASVTRIGDTFSMGTHVRSPVLCPTLSGRILKLMERT